MFKVPVHFPSIQSAVDAAHDGAVVAVAPGNYKENVIITKSLQLTRLGDFGEVVVCPPTGPALQVFSEPSM